MHRSIARLAAAAAVAASLVCPALANGTGENDVVRVEVVDFPDVVQSTQVIRGTVRVTNKTGQPVVAKIRFAMPTLIGTFVSQAKPKFSLAAGATDEVTISFARLGTVPEGKDVLDVSVQAGGAVVVVPHEFTVDDPE